MFMGVKYRLVTRSDFDGLVCAALLKELDMIDDILFVHPKDMQDGKIPVTDRDITTNLPYAASAHLVFDHHHSEELRDGQVYANFILMPDADSTARVVYEHFGGASRFNAKYEEMVAACDKADSARFTEDDILHPTDWVYLSFLMDARTGLGRFRNFRISNYDLMMELIDYCRNHTVRDIMDLPDVRERVELYEAHQDKAVEQIRRCSMVHGSLVVLDLREEETIWVTNRFMIYALFPQCNVSIHVIWGLKKQNTVFATGKSILNRSCPVDIGELMLRYGGGGHEAAGTCQIDNDKAGGVLTELVRALA